MNRYRQYQPLDDIPQPLGEAPVGPLDMRGDPALLPPGWVRRSQNFRVSPAGADRPGRQVRAGIARQLAVGDVLQPILHAGIYRPDGENDHHALVTKDRLILFDPYTQTVATYAYPLGETVAAGDPVDFVQAGVSSGTIADAYILRGTSKTALKFNYATVAVAANFQRGDFGLFFLDRMAVKSGAQTMGVSDFLDFTVWTLLNQFKVGYGGDDYLVGFYPYQKDFVIIGTRKRFYLAYLSPNIGASGSVGGVNSRDSFLRVLTREAGPLGRTAMLEAGGLIWFISDNGIFAFQPQLDLELTMLGEPISAAIQPVFNRLSADYASGATIQHLGHRLYFALPISDEPVVLASVTGQLLEELTVPFDLPALVGGGYLITLTTATAHGLSVDETVEIAGTLDANLNGTKAVASVINATQFTILVDYIGSLTVGERATVQRIATRNNVVLVFNRALKSAESPLGSWESVDRLPSGLAADFLHVADAGGQRRLWMIDRDLGPCLYETGATDEMGEAVGGLNLPFDLPGELSLANFESKPIAGWLTSRTLRWGPYPQEVRCGEARLTCDPEDAGTLTLTARTPDRPEYNKTRTFDGLRLRDTSARLRCGKRALEAELNLITTTGRPTVRAWGVETTAAGRIAEE